MAKKPIKRKSSKTRSKYTVSDFKEAIKDCNGNKSLVRRRLKCSSQTLYVYLEKYPELKRLIEIEGDYYKSSLLDLARVKLYKDVLAGKPYAITLVIRTLGKDEGFAERKELTTPDGQQPFQLNVTIETDDTPLKDRDDD